MDIKDLNKPQLILLAVLLSFVTSIATGITTVTLMQQAPASFTTPVNNVIKQKKSGNQINYFLDYSKEELTPSLYIVEYSRFEKLPAKVRLAINDFLKELKDKPVVVVIFGSYANGTYTKNSDIDILLVFQKIENPKEIENTAKKIGMKTNTQLNPIYLDYQVFKESFHNSTKEFFKKLKRDKIILTGIEWWRQLSDEEA